MGEPYPNEIIGTGSDSNTQRPAILSIIYAKYNKVLRFKIVAIIGLF